MEEYNKSYDRPRSQLSLQTKLYRTDPLGIRNRCLWNSKHMEIFRFRLFRFERRIYNRPMGGEPVTKNRIIKS